MRNGNSDDPPVENCIQQSKSYSSIITNAHLSKHHLCDSSSRETPKSARPQSRPHTCCAVSQPQMLRDAEEHAILPHGDQIGIYSPDPESQTHNSSSNSSPAAANMEMQDSWHNSSGSSNGGLPAGVPAHLSLRPLSAMTPTVSGPAPQPTIMALPQLVSPVSPGSHHMQLPASSRLDSGQSSGYPDSLPHQQPQPQGPQPQGPQPQGQLAPGQQPQGHQAQPQQAQIQLMQHTQPQELKQEDPLAQQQQQQQQQQYQLPSISAGQVSFDLPINVCQQMMQPLAQSVQPQQPQHIQTMQHQPTLQQPISRPTSSVPPTPPTQASRGRNSTGSAAVMPVGFPVRYAAHPCPSPKTMANAPEQISLLPSPEQIVKKRYATSMDERNFLTVYEYIVRDYPVIWDYYTGFVHLTGIWKMLGNSKADIVRLLDNAPDLEPHIRRVRGGFLRIQGTWLPYEIARSVATRICWPIRYALVPVFGPAFPEDCLHPDAPGYGQLQPLLPAKRSYAQALSQPSPASNLRVVEQLTQTPPVSPLESHRGIRRRMSVASTASDYAPAKVALESQAEQQPEELLSMLQASRSLQLLSAGPQYRLDNIGADFEYGGRRYSWDGQAKLSQLT